MPSKAKESQMFTDRMYEVADEYARWRNAKDIASQMIKGFQKIADKVGKEVQDGYYFMDNGTELTGSVMLEFNHLVKAMLELQVFLDDKSKILMSRMETLIAQERIGIQPQTFMNMILRGRKEKKTGVPENYTMVDGMKIPIIKVKDNQTRLPLAPKSSKPELSLVSRPRNVELVNDD